MLRCQNGLFPLSNPTPTGGFFQTPLLMAPLCSRPRDRDARSWGFLKRSCALATAWVFLLACCDTVSSAEPARQFLKQLRAAGLFDSATTYLDRLDQYPGIDPELIKAVQLERAQIFIDAGLATNQLDSQDDQFRLAEQ